MTPPADPTRALRRAAGTGAVVAFALFLLLVTYGRPWDLAPREALGNFYDAQAESFTHGHLTVDPAEVSFEGFLVDGRTYEYQGPVPALMRLPLQVVTDRFHGRLTRLSMLAAYATALWFLVGLQLTARRAVRGAVPLAAGERWWTGVTTFGLGASSLLFLASKAWVYHEALLWGVAFSLGCFLHLGTWLTRPATGPGQGSATGARPERWYGDRHLVLAAVFAGLALLTRSAVGAGPMAALLLTGGVQGVHLVLAPRRPVLAARLARLAGWRRSTAAGLVVLVLGVAIPVGVYAAINEAKFGTLFSLPADKQVLVQHDPARQAFFAQNGNSLFGIKFVPSVLTQAVRPDAVALGGSFPFIAFTRSRPAALGDVLFAERDWSSSVTDSEPLLVLLGLLGLAALVAPKRLAGAREGAGGGEGDVAVLRLPVLGAVAGGAGFFAIGYMANRYMSDLFPLVALAAVVGVQVVVARAAAWSTGARRVATAGVAALALWGAWANLGLGSEYQRVIAPGTSAAQRADWLRAQARLGPTPATARVGLLAPLPPEPARGRVAVVGDCDAVYRSNGAIWLPLEGGPRAGYLRGMLRLRSLPVGPVTLLSGGPDRLVLEPVGPGRVRFVAVAGTTRSLPGPAVTLVPGRGYPVAITFDWRSGYAEVLQGSREWLASNVALTPAVPRIDRSFPGSLAVRPPSTATCRALG